MRVTKADTCYVACLINDRSFYFKEICRDEDTISKIVKEEKAFFYNHVLKEISPEWLKGEKDFMKGIEWIKINTNMCEDEKMRLLDSMDIRDVGIYLWLRLLLQAGKVNDNGLIHLKSDVPYTKQMLSILFNRPIDIIEKVFEILVDFQMIEIYENNIIKICNWEKHQNIEGMKRVREGNKERVKNFRERKKEEEISSVKIQEKEFDKNEHLENKNCNANVTLQKEKREEDKQNKKKNFMEKLRIL